jgi:hypothetical protein
MKMADRFIEPAGASHDGLPVLIITFFGNSSTALPGIGEAIFCQRMRDAMLRELT